ncbi:hypothetical protein GCU68_09635 [Natronorubrum aibiense]|uniref:Uncharacterized protein n=1 Tax=Natronorubrum aibiense TaxID=348826 RepID=A0A5P9P464_9EURY|nr:hypothetical protein GCU68_09635 [Natronorubrum aibiense]
MHDESAIRSERREREPQESERGGTTRERRLEREPRTVRSMCDPFQSLRYAIGCQPFWPPMGFTLFSQLGKPRTT